MMMLKCVPMVCAAVLACGGATIVPGTSANAASPTIGTGTGTLTLGVAAAPQSLAASDGTGVPWFSQAVYDSLLRNSDSNQLEPDLATAWAYNSTNTVLKMTLRTGVKFTDGSPFTASVAAENLTQLKASSSTLSSDLSSVSSIVATDPTHLVISLSQPDPGLLYNLSQQAGDMESVAYIGNKTNPIGTGPYVYDSGASFPGSTYVYTKNPGYWNKPEQYYSKIVLKVLGDSTSTLNAIQANQVDAADLTLVLDVSPVRSQPGWRLLSFPFGYSILLLLDRDGTQSACLKSVKVRQAINYAIDREGLSKAIVATEGGSVVISDSTFVPGVQGYSKAMSNYYTYNPTKAKHLMKAAGYAQGCTVTLMNFAQLQQSNNLLTPELTAIGIKVNLNTVSLTQSLNELSTAQVPATVWGLGHYALAWEDVEQLYAPNAAIQPLSHLHASNAKPDRSFAEGDVVIAGQCGSTADQSVCGAASLECAVLVRPELLRRRAHSERHGHGRSHIRGFKPLGHKAQAVIPCLPRFTSSSRDSWQAVCCYWPCARPPSSYSMPPSGIRLARYLVRALLAARSRKNAGNLGSINHS